MDYSNRIELYYTRLFNSDEYTKKLAEIYLYYKYQKKKPSFSA
jgi:hypothetical protein